MASDRNPEEHKDGKNELKITSDRYISNQIRDLTSSGNPEENEIKEHLTTTEERGEKNPGPTLRILLTGSSHIHRLESSILQGCFPCSRLDFGTGQDVHFLGIGGAKVATLRNSSHLESLLEETRPDVVIVHIGSNDADSTKTSSDICAEILGFVRILKTKFQVFKVYFSQLFRRQATRRISVADYNKKILEINRRLRKEKTVTFWKHKKMMEPVKNILLKEGVHLNMCGQVLFYRSFMKAIYAAVREHEYFRSKREKGKGELPSVAS
ncbi:uncharacterized protein LOC135480280 [Liolophura sinensis]|uniref:uncharacterized protein LOC135480280 n=1 Tax=Liolophura sinensis TaxID=3198878 RepID=UPI0031593AE9